MNSGAHFSPGYSGAVPPTIEQAERERIAMLVFLFSAVGVGVAVILYFFNPSQFGFYPSCMFRRVTGLLCPGCGSLRAAHELLHGHLGTALRLNALFVLGLPAGAGIGSWWLARKLQRPS